MCGYLPGATLPPLQQHTTLPTVIRRGWKQDGANAEGRKQKERNEKESANDYKPLGASRQEGREEQGGLWARCLTLSASQLP